MALWSESLFGRARRAHRERAFSGRCWSVQTLRFFVGVGLLAACVGYSQGAPATSPPATDESLAEEHRSVFISDPAAGKDPFFPKSKRRDGQIVTPQPVAVPTPAPNLGEPPWEQFKLKGISISAGRRLAIINNYTMAEGEDRKFVIDNQVYLLRCVTVLEQSAVISIKGRTKELSLREGL